MEGGGAVMPSHQERVQRNYETMTVRQEEWPMHNAVQVAVVVTKKEIASWRDKRAIARGIAGKVYDQVMGLK